MKALPILLPTLKPHKWSYPNHLINLFKWNNLQSSIELSTDLNDFDEIRPLYSLNLNNMYRVDTKLAMSAGPDNHCVYEALNFDIYKKVVDNDGYLLLDMAVESLSPKEKIAKGIINGITSHQLDAERVIILNSNLKSSRALYSYWSQQGITSIPKIVGFDSCFWLLAGFNKIITSNESSLIERFKSVERDLHVHRETTFVSFNGRNRPHRFFILLWLFTKRILATNKISFLCYQSSRKSSERIKLITQLRTPKWNLPDLDKCLLNLDAFLDLLPLTLDVTQEDSLKDSAYKTSLPWRNQDPAFYDSSYFSIIIDTSFFESNILFLTPIAFKSFMNLSPFIYFGNPGALKRMRELGFKTFSPFINESYDDESNHSVRLKLALDEVERIHNLPPEQLSSLFKDLWPVVSHNYWHFYRDIHRFSKNIFQSQLISRLTD